MNRSSVAIVAAATAVTATVVTGALLLRFVIIQGLNETENGWFDKRFEAENPISYQRRRHRRPRGYRVVGYDGPQGLPYFGPRQAFGERVHRIRRRLDRRMWAAVHD